MATLFVKNERGRKVRMMQVAVPGLGRKTLRLGQLPARAAERFRDKVEALVAFRALNQPLDPEMAAWLAGLPDAAYAQLVAAGLASPRDGSSAMPTLKVFFDKYISQKSGGVAPRSIQLLEQTRDRMVKHFGANTRLDRITPDGAADWRGAMLSDGLSEASARLHSRNAKSLFNSAVDRELVSRNPFRLLPTSAIAANRDRYVTVDEAERVIANLPHPDFRLLFALARFAGLRIPSESHLVCWSNVDWQGRKLTVFAPKTGSSRVVPVQPRLLELLRDAHARREPGEERILTISTNNLHRRLHAAIEKAGLERWPDLYQALRRSCETDFAMQGFPPHATAMWLGHGIAVSARFYLQVPAELYERAAAGSGRSALQNALQHGTAQRRTTPHLALAGQTALPDEVA